MLRETKRTILEIKSLKVQGARNVARASISALLNELRHPRAGTPAGLLAELTATGKALCASRPTEPMMRNNFDMFLNAARKLASGADRGGGAVWLRNKLLAYEKAALRGIDEDKERLTEYGARLIPDGATVMTHCHSSTATGILMKAKKSGKRFEVIACETRPRWQGRITAQELARAGIKVSLIVDGGANMFMKKSDMVLVGADAITSRGDLINKVGTSMLAHIARMHDVSFYSAAELFKYSPMTMFGVLERIEQRSPAEVWEKPPKGVRIQNPAFDVTAAGYIAGYITEAGVLPPQSFFSFASRKIEQVC